MTFNNLEVHSNIYNKDYCHNDIYDGPNIAVIHDGKKRYVYLKNQQYTIVSKELTGNKDVTYIGANNNSVYFIDPNVQKVKSISTSGQDLDEQIYNINDFNYLQDYSYIGDNATLNLFTPNCGFINSNYIVVGGSLSNVTSSLIIDGASVVENSICYMYSDNNGSTFKGPFFPLVKSNNAVINGELLRVLLVNDNWYFYYLHNGETQLSVVQSLGVDLIGDNLFDEPLLGGDVHYQCSMVYFDNKIYYQALDRNSYYEYDLESDSNFRVSLDDVITSMTIIGNDLYITTKESCNSRIINSSNRNASNTIGSITVNNQDFLLNIQLGKTLVKERDTILSPQFTDSSTVKVVSDHYLYPSKLEIKI